eukprot:GGOE01014202.1.p1 GENE.GGOE01014202.1~~GGOE01014202.1.p1  ORF type:complete len:257 (+),score=81.43 GGOE01014202.1:50-820(+)
MRRYDPQHCPPVYHSEFLAGSQLVKINPKFELQQPLQFISGTFGPFKPSREAVVPLWLALDLKKRGMCEIYPPDWLQTAQLQKFLDMEKDNHNDFVPLPYHFLEIGKMLVDANPDYLRGNEELCDEIRALLRDIDTHREEKVRQGLRTLQSYVSGIKLANLTSIEVHSVRPILASLFDKLRFLELRPEAPLPPMSAEPDQSQSSAPGLADSSPHGASPTISPAQPAAAETPDSATAEDGPLRIAPTKKRRTLRDSI